jgi:lipoyl(octanoyl) transferase|tara:strand:- start:3640 stop:4344 length:705 start_codon:yes stop_codon:yes gene_type:complete
LHLSQYKWFNATADVETADNQPELTVRRLGLQDYTPIWRSMQYRAVNTPRDSERADELWFLSHKPVYTQGQAGESEHLINVGKIPVVQIDRGGQVTYHGPGQLVVYFLLNLRRRKLGSRGLVDLIEQSLIGTLRDFDIDAQTRPKAPGVYVNDAKIAALGLRIKNGWSYHGLSLNVDMDLAPFAGINPCGFSNLAVCQIADFQPKSDMLMQQASRVLCDHLLMQLGYSAAYSKQ